MSSTNRGYQRHISDFYITPQEPIKKFLDKFLSIESVDRNSLILDPCAGGNDKYDMPYLTVLGELGFKNIITNDIREDGEEIKDLQKICNFYQNNLHLVLEDDKNVLNIMDEIIFLKI